MKGVLELSDLFFLHQLKRLYAIFILLIQCFTLMDFGTLNQPLHSCNTSYFVMVNNFFYMALDLACQHFVEDFYIQDEE